MSNLITIEDAAKMLGISVDTLQELISNKEIFAVKVGNTWKFKSSEVQRYADEIGVQLRNLFGDVGTSSPAVDPDDESFKVTDSIKDMLVEIEDDDEDLSSLSGISGFDSMFDDDDQPKSADRQPDDSDEMESVDLFEDSSVDFFGLEDQPRGKPERKSGNEPESVEIELGGGIKDGNGNRIRSEKGETPDDSVLDDEELSMGSSSIRLAADSASKLSTDEDESSIFDDDEIGNRKSPSDTGRLLNDDLAAAESADDLFGNDLQLADSLNDSSQLSTDFSDSEDLILDDSDSSSEIKLESSGSGVMLVDDAGDDFNESDFDSLELADDDSYELDDASDDEFNLTPLADALEEDDSTGSQVIALDESGIYVDDSAEGVVIIDESDGFGEVGPEAVMLDDGDSGFGPAFDSNVFAPDPIGMTLGPAQTPEAPFSIWNVLALAVVTLFMLMGSMIAYEACQNMWMPDDSVSRRGLLSFFLGLGGG
jgi:excisionase family DNA binding protein